MVLQKLFVNNFRNLKKQKIDFHKVFNIFCGKNGQGKTNILEAIHFLLKAKSFRKNTSFEQMISFETDYNSFEVSGRIDNQTRSVKLDSGKQIWSEDSSLKKRVSKKDIVFISPFEAFQFFDQRKFRVNFLDGAFRLNALSNKLLKMTRMRKAILEGPRSLSSEKLFYSTTQEYALTSLKLAKLRRDGVNILAKIFPDLVCQFYNENLKVDLAYDTKLPSLLNEEEVLLFFHSISTDEWKSYRAGYGVHRDDFKILINGLEAGDYGSVGQQKVFYMAAKLSHLTILTKNVDNSPILLIDDLSGELDYEKWKLIFEFLKTNPVQTFITTANDGFAQRVSMEDGYSQFQVEKGEVFSNCP